MLMEIGNVSPARDNMIQEQKPGLFPNQNEKRIDFKQ